MDSEGDAELHAKHCGIRDLAGTAGLFHVLQIRLDIGEVGELDAITQLEDPFVVGTAIALGLLLVRVVIAQLTIGGTEDQPVFGIARPG